MRIEIKSRTTGEWITVGVRRTASDVAATLAHWETMGFQARTVEVEY